MINVRIRAFAFGAAIAIAQWPDGTVSRDPATDLAACLAAAEAWTSGRALPLGQSRAAITVLCQPADATSAGFAPGWDCIRGFNCK